MDDLEVILKNGKHSDVEIVVSGHQFKAHKAILAARSPVFAAMFDNQMKESQQNRVEINDIDEEVFEKVLRFIYCDKVCNEDIESNIGLFIIKYKKLCFWAETHQMVSNSTFNQKVSRVCVH